MALRALIFDVDGTLAETERDGHRLAFNGAFAAAGLGWHWDVPTYGELLAIAGGKERMLAWWSRTAPDEAADPRLRDAMLQRLRELHADKTLRYSALVAQGAVALRPGVARLLAEVRAQQAVDPDAPRLAIATTTTPENVTALLEHALGPAALRWFDVIGAGDDVAAKKPAPDIYHWVLGRLGIGASEALAFEDSRVGLRSARAAGLPTVVTPGIYTAHEAFPEALAVIGSLGEPQAPASGRVPKPGAAPAWHGVVDLATLRAWHAHATQRAPRAISAV